MNIKADLSFLLEKKSYFVSGIGTGVGKTFTCAYLASELINIGKNVSYMKAIQTGVKDEPSDMQIVKQKCPKILIHRRYSCPYTFKIPASPHFAAMCENRKINVDKIKNAYRNMRALYPDSITLIEGAGGLMVPIKTNFLFIDLIRELSLPLILVSSPYLGAINHTLLSLFLLKKYKITLLMLAFSINKEKLSDIEKNTLDTILKISKVKNYIIVPFQEK